MSKNKCNGDIWMKIGVTNRQISPRSIVVGGSPLAQFQLRSRRRLKPHAFRNGVLSLAKFVARGDEDGDSDQHDGRWSPATRRDLPPIAYFDEVLAPLTVFSVFLLPQCRGGAGGRLIAGRARVGQKFVQFLRRLRQLIFIANPHGPAGAVGIDTGVDSLRQQIIGQTLGLFAVGEDAGLSHNWQWSVFGDQCVSFQLFAESRQLRLP